LQREKRAKKSAVYDAWLEDHTKCTVNHPCSAASMEFSGVVTIFNHSEMKYGVKYVEYIGGSDTKSFKNVYDSMSYGPHIEIKKKLNPWAMVKKKRIGTRLRNLK
jgi:hypothetical protein